jgi:hypothetical protein
MKFTAGPWVWSGVQLLAQRDMASECVLIAHPGRNDAFILSDPDKALVAAAPDLHEALTNLVQANDDLTILSDRRVQLTVSWEAWQAAQDALAKAQGPSL